MRFLFFIAAFLLAAVASAGYTTSIHQSTITTVIVATNTVTISGSTITQTATITSSVLETVTEAAPETETSTEISGAREMSTVGSVAALAVAGLLLAAF